MYKKLTYKDGIEEDGTVVKNCNPFITKPRAIAPGTVFMVGRNCFAATQDGMVVRDENGQFALFDRECDLHA
jgi:hypothetical protein